MVVTSGECLPNVEKREMITETIRPMIPVAMVVDIVKIHL